MLTIDDLLSELDVLAVDSTVLAYFEADVDAASANLGAKRRVVVDDWLRGSLEQAGYTPERHTVRRAPERVLGYTGGAFSDLTSLMSETSTDQLGVSTVIASATNDALYIRSRQPFRALWVAMFDSVNSTPGCVMKPTYWDGGRWAQFNSLVDGTAIAAQTALSGGGRVEWQLPTNWQKRPLHDETDWGYWARLQFNIPPAAAAKISYLMPVRASRLTSACVYRVLSMLYSESWGAQHGEWKEKAAQYAEDASEMLQRALPQIVDEFVNTDSEEAVTATITAAVVPPDASLFTFERG